jgi:hypothetical protein
LGIENTKNKDSKKILEYLHSKMEEESFDGKDEAIPNLGKVVDVLALDLYLNIIFSSFSRDLSLPLHDDFFSNAFPVVSFSLSPSLQVEEESFDGKDEAIPNLGKVVDVIKQFQNIDNNKNKYKSIFSQTFGSVIDALETSLYDTSVFPGFILWSKET